MIAETSKLEPRRQFGVNTISSILVFVFNLAIGLWFTPFLINNLGIASYGLIPLANTITSYLSLITLSINGAVGRFLAIDIQKNDYEEANKTFNTALVSLLFIAVVILPISIVFVLFVPKLFDVPIGQEQSSVYLFLFIVLAFFVTQVDTCFSVASWAKSRFDLRNIVLISSQLAKLIIVIVLFWLIKPEITYVGISIFLAAIINLLGDVILWRILTPSLHVSLINFDRTRVRVLFGMGGWMIMNQIGTILFINIDLVVSNIVLGATAAGEYGSILVFSTLTRSLAHTLSSVFYPTIVSKYAHNDMESVTKLSNQAVHLLGYVIGLLAGLICGFGKPFLSLWLGPEFADLNILLFLLIIPLPINLSVQPLFGIQMAMNKVKAPGIVTVVMGLGNLILALVFTLAFGWGYYGIAIAGALVLTLKNSIFTPLYGAYIQNIPWFTYIKSMVPGLILSVAVFALAYITSSLVDLNSWLKLILVSSTFGLIGVLLIIFRGLRKEDKQLLLSFIPISILQRGNL